MIDIETSSTVKKSEKSFSKELAKDAKKGEFIENLDGFIKYFEDTVDSKRSQQIFTPKENKLTQRENENSAAEIRSLKQHIEKMKVTINELISTNQNLNEEITTFRSREDEFKIVKLFSLSNFRL